MVPHDISNTGGNNFSRGARIQNELFTSERSPRKERNGRGARSEACRRFHLALGNCREWVTLRLEGSLYCAGGRNWLEQLDFGG
ncbi:hypothetical protein BHE74_00056384 [Ensete ventricosum]|nr:hypothetical protein GW17_00015742 [Ensete ventricosum]RWW38383.1 hypothetical protein BHE74_00056384 [Ensete ventricosum]RZS27102.1 hypothetical protein BHM03_00060539 [Ensete ventricosum]